MSRLVFAAARGARIESQMHDGPWLDAYAVATRQIGVMIQRIHHEDAHLAYGPISTALRKAAGAKLTLKSGIGPMLMLPFVTYHRMGSGDFGKHCNYELHRSIFLLILAESLADEGL